MEEKENLVENKEQEVVEVKKKDDFVIPLSKEEKEKNAPKILKPNSKPFWSMRIAGGLIDLFLMFLATMGLFYAFSSSPMGNSLRNYSREMALIAEDYKLVEFIEGSDETVGYKVHENQPEFAGYTTYLVHDADETGYKYVVINNGNISKELQSAYTKAVKADKKYSNLSFDYQLVEYGITMLAGFISMATFLLVIPLCNKRRASLGKLFAGTQLINSKYQVPAKWYQVTWRFIFQFLIEGALPYLFIYGWTTLAMPILLFIISLIDREHGRTLHDFVSRTKVIDKKTFKPLSEQ